MESKGYKINTNKAPIINNVIYSKSKYDNKKLAKRIGVTQMDEKFIEIIMLDSKLYIIKL